MLFCSLVTFVVLQNTAIGASRVAKKIFVIESQRTLPDFPVSMVVPTERPGNRIRKVRNVNSFRPYCQPWDSCKNRCGNITIMPYSCSCDSMCFAFGDCCIDYRTACRYEESQDFNAEEKLKCLHENMLSPVYAIASCPANYTSDATKAKCERIVSPVTDINGFVYANSHCAHCHGENGTLYPWKKTTELFNPPNEWPEIRMCHPVIENCSINATCTQDIRRLCQRYSGPVLGYNSEKYYKNIYCALCNGEFLERLSCPVWSFTGLYFLPSLQNSVRKISDCPRKGLKTHRIDQDSVPASFSILLNFGLDGKERMMFSSEDEEETKKNQERCGKNKIWDPFSNICRTLYCSAEFVLIDFRCIPKSGISDNTPEEEPNAFDIDPECVHLSLDIEISYLDILKENITEYSRFSDYLHDSLASFFNITRNRIQELNLTYTGMKYSESAEEILNDAVTFVVAFDLCETSNKTLKSEPTVDNLMAMIASYVSLNNFILGVGNVSTKISEIRQTMDPISSWCNGVFEDYWNQDFTLITDYSSPNSDWIKEVYINKTGKTYKKGEFIGNILFQGSVNNENLVNVSGMVIVCEKAPTLNLSCPRLLLSRDEFNLTDDDVLIYRANPDAVVKLNASQYELTENESALVCYEPDLYKKLSTKGDSEYSLHFDTTQAVVSLVLLCISIIALAIVLLTYLLFSVLRTLPGCNVMNLTGSALAMQITFLIGQRNSVKGVYCKVAGILIHFEILATFFWMNVMAYDLFKKFGTKNIMARVKDRRVLWYSLYAYGVPSLIIILAYSLDTWYPVLGPNYGFENNCWITNKKAALLFFASPLAAILLTNSVLYTMTVCAISSLQKIIRSKSEKAQRKNEDVLYMRMATVMGFTWAFAFFAAWYPKNQLLGQILTYLFIIFNTLQGLFIFFGFVCNSRVLKLYLDVFHKIKVPGLKLCPKCTKHYCDCQPKICRTVSSESTLSTMSISGPELISYNSISEK